LINDAIYDESNDKITDVLSVNKKKKKQKIIKEGFNLELDKLRTFKDDSVRELLEIESRERENTGIKTLKVGYNNVFGYYIEVSKSFKDIVPYYYERRQTISNGERFVTQELRDLEYKILTSESQAEVLELEIYNKIKGVLLENVPKLKRTADALAELDIYISLATVARENNFIKPNILEEGSALEIIDGRHPVVEATMKQKFVPNDAYLDNDKNRTILITGPNMAGKSTYMRQVALITLMAHIGSFVPASKANIPLTDKIFTRIGASDNLISDQSTFMVEMSETADIIKNATKNSLIILDEIGRGTSTYDGLSIAWAVMEYINENIKAKTLFATHYHELTNLENVLKGVKNYKINVKELNGTIIFLRKIMRGATNRSFGIEVADLAGVKKEVTDRAKKLLKSLENKSVDANTIVSNDYIYETETASELSEVEKIIKELDINNMSPIHAFNILCYLQ
jgi:DNA mismatch repair protein MutS